MGCINDKEQPKETEVKEDQYIEPTSVNGEQPSIIPTSFTLFCFQI